MALLVAVGVGNRQQVATGLMIAFHVWVYTYLHAYMVSAAAAVSYDCILYMGLVVVSGLHVLPGVHSEHMGVACCVQMITGKPRTLTARCHSAEPTTTICQPPLLCCLPTPQPFFLSWHIGARRTVTQTASVGVIVPSNVLPCPLPWQTSPTTPTWLPQARAHQTSQPRCWQQRKRLKPISMSSTGSRSRSRTPPRPVMLKLTSQPTRLILRRAAPAPRVSAADCKCLCPMQPFLIVVFGSRIKHTYSTCWT